MFSNIWLKYEYKLNIICENRILKVQISEPSQVLLYINKVHMSELHCEAG